MNEQRLLREDLAHFPKLNINSVRIGSHVEMDVFYDICDEMGLLLWASVPHALLLQRLRPTDSNRQRR